jgi:SagB-type dehydrogenase family enzyme
MDTRTLRSSGGPAEYEFFHAASGLEGWQVDRLRLADPAGWPKAWTTVVERDAGRLPLVALPEPRPLALRLDEALARRRTDRAARAGVDLAGFADLLGWSLGLREEPGAERGARRRYPSAGARFPVDCHVLALNIEGLSRGAYVYSPFEHGLLSFNEEVSDTDVEQLLGFGDVAPPRAVLVLTAAMQRTTCKYGNRGYRYALIEAGHIMQNLYLTATALDLPLAAVGGFCDSDARRLVDGQQTDEIPLYCAVIP